MKIGPALARELARMLSELGGRTSEAFTRVAKAFEISEPDARRFSYVGEHMSDEALEEFFAPRPPDPPPPIPFTPDEVRALFERNGMPQWHWFQVLNPATGKLEPLSGLGAPRGKGRTVKVKGTNGGRKLAPHLVKEVLALYQAGEPLRTIWSRTAVTPSQILELAHKHGVRSPRAKGALSGPRKRRAP